MFCKMGLRGGVFTMEIRLTFGGRHGHRHSVLIFCNNRNFFFKIFKIVVRMVLALFRNNMFWVLVLIVVLSLFRDDMLCVLVFIKVLLLHHNGMVGVIDLFVLCLLFDINRKGFFVVVFRVERLVKGFLLFLAFFILVLDNVNCNRAKIIANKRHAAFVLARNKQRAASTEAVSIMLTSHSIATVNRAKDIARQD